MSAGILQLTVEEELLIALCRMHFDDELSLRIKILIDKITDWEKFVRLSNEQGVIALCWHNIEKAGLAEKIPDTHREIMHKSFLKSVARNTFLNKSIEELSSLVKNDFGKIVLIKGMALERNIYGNSGLRQMTDIDILTEEGSAMRLREFLLSNGYESDPVISGIYEKRMFMVGKHLPEMRKNGVSIEIHFKLFREAENFLTRKLLSGSQAVPGTGNLFIPEPQVHFLYLLRHLDKHEQENEFQVRLYTDLVVLLSEYGEEILNEELCALSQQAGIYDFLLRTLLCLKIFWGITFSDRIELQISGTNKESVSDNFIKFLRSKKTRNEQLQTYNPLKSLRYIPGPVNKFLFITGYLVPSIAYMKAKYHTKSSFICILLYPVRWVHIGLWIVGLREKVTENA
jgi:hypothetical protein